MVNWNYDKAKQFADAITDEIPRRLTQLFLNKVYFLAFQQYAIPENMEIDLLCLTKIIEKIVREREIIMRCLQGEDLDSAWDALNDELK